MDVYVCVNNYDVLDSICDVTIYKLACHYTYNIDKLVRSRYADISNGTISMYTMHHFQ